MEGEVARRSPLMCTQSVGGLEVNCPISFSDEKEGGKAHRDEF